MIERKSIRRQDDRDLLHDYQELKRQKCAVHDILQDETKDHRVVVCNKIADARKVAEAALPRWVFILTMGAVLTVSMTVLGIMWDSNSKGQNEIKKIIQDGNAVLHRRITEAANDTDIIKDMVRDVQKQQAVLDNKLHNVEMRLDKK